MTTRWGILAPGRIAHVFARDLATVQGAEVVAVGSRSIDRARDFAARHGGTAYGDYQSLTEAPDVDVVYVASPHALHREHVMLCLEAGKHVLCEKPVTLRAADAAHLTAAAVDKGLFFMEAMRTACHPLVRQLLAGLEAGRFGVPRHLHAELGGVIDLDPKDRMLEPALGAGVLLDMGVYALTLADLLLGTAEDLSATAVLSDSGIDLATSLTGRYPRDALATLTATMTSCSSQRAEIGTDRGRLSLTPFYDPVEVTFTPFNRGGEAGDTQTIQNPEPVLGSGFVHEILEVQRCLSAGLIESPLVPHAQTLRILAQMDALRAQIGVRYAGDPKPQ